MREAVGVLGREADPLEQLADPGGRVLLFTPFPEGKTREQTTGSLVTFPQLIPFGVLVIQPCPGPAFVTFTGSPIGGGAASAHGPVSPGVVKFAVTHTS